MANNLLQMSIGRAHDNIDSLMLNGYKGTLPLTMEMFPEKRWSDDQGRQWTSNIKTRLEKDNGKWYLFPTMMGGLDLPEAGAYRGALKGKHFGVYDSYDEGMKADRVIHNHFEKIKGYQNGGTVEPISTNVHNRIDDLILKADLDKFDQNGFMYADKTPAYIGGVDPVVENIAMGPLLTLKSLGSVGKKLLERTGLRNPVSHYTGSQGATNILKTGKIAGTGKFPGRPDWFDMTKSQRAAYAKNKKKVENEFAVSVTRDPMFTSRPHSNIGTDIRFILDRDELARKGFKMSPFAHPYYRKTAFHPVKRSVGGGVDKYNKKIINPKFEFEERVRGNIPTENIRLIDLITFPQGGGNRFEAAEMLNQLGKSNIPIIRSSETTDRIRLMDEIFRRTKKGLQSPRYSGSPLQEILNRLLEAPTY